MNRLLYILILTALFFQCNEQQEKKFDFKQQTKNFLSQDLVSFKGHKIRQIERCFVEINTPDGFKTMFTGIPTKEEISQRIGNPFLHKLIVMCQKNNIYSFESIEDNFLIKTKNSLCSFKELKEKDKTYYDKSLKEAKLLNDTLNIKMSLCYFLGNDQTILDSLTNERKIYKFRKDIYYYWDFISPLILNCEN